MIHLKNRKLQMLFIAVTVIVLTVFIISTADGGAPGSDSDPLVTQSYVEQKIDQIKFYADSIIGNITEDNKKTKEEIATLKVLLQQKNEEITKITEQISKITQNSSGVAKFEVVKLNKNQSIITGDGSEIIPRSGKMVAIYGQNGGLSDITSAKDLKAGEAIVLNHMLISSRNDGRGLKATTEVYLLIKGSYVLK